MPALGLPIHMFNLSLFQQTGGKHRQSLLVQPFRAMTTALQSAGEASPAESSPRTVCSTKRSQESSQLFS
jgi:hypothetical protein